MNNKVYMIYDLKNNECCVAQFDSQKDIAEYFNIAYKSVACAISRHYKVKNRYSIEKVSL